MDKLEHEEWQFLNIIGILRESFKVLRSYARLFALLTVTFILPLCFIVLAHDLVTRPLLHKIRENEFVVHEEAGTRAARISEKALTGELVRLLLFLIAYLVFVIAFSLLSTAAIVYSVACIYTEKGLSFSKVVSVVPKVWKRLIVTFLWGWLFMFMYQIVFVVCIFLVILIFSAANTTLLYTVAWLTVILYLGVLVYFSCIWHLSYVISVLEESGGLGALSKGVSLIRGKQLVGYGLFAIFLLCTTGIGMLFNIGVLHRHDQSSSKLSRVMIGAILVLLLTVLNLLMLVVETVFYFACKSYHHERIDKVALSEHLGAYLGEYMPLKGAIQLEAL